MLRFYKTRKWLVLNGKAKNWTLLRQGNPMYILTATNSSRQIFLNELTDPQLVKKFPQFTEAESRYCIHKRPPPAPSWARSIQTIPLLPSALRFILILSSLLRLGNPSGLFLSRFPSKTFMLLSSCRKFYVYHLIHLYLITGIIFGEVCRSQNSSVCRLFQYQRKVEETSSILGQNIFLNAIFSNNISLFFSPSWSNQASRAWTQQAKLQFCLS